MKKTILTLVLAVMVGGSIHAQDTLRLPMTPIVNYYPECVVWMTDNPDSSYLSISKRVTIHGAIEVYGFPIATPMRVVGLAGIMDTVRRYELQYYRDTTLEGRLPEYFCLYQPGPDTMELKKMACWTDVQPRCRIKLRVSDATGGSHWEYPNLNEVYFDDTVTVQDSFYVGYTSFNNYRPILENGFPDRPPYFETEAFVGGSYHDHYFNKQTRFRVRNTKNDDDTITWRWLGYGCGEFMVFPIIDTTGMGAQTDTTGQGDTTIVDTTRISPMAEHFTHLLPNPATDHAVIYSSFPMLSVAVFDPTGRLLLRQRVDDRTLHLDLTGYTRGLYHVVINTPAGRTVKRLLVQ